ncbi:MAG: hypothetical protein KDA52_14750, partial [Planctomycetaceae bacterium]|nr:hypothetical protein [Planctomycetaceae bacterium]
MTSAPELLFHLEQPPQLQDDYPRGHAISNLPATDFVGLQVATPMNQDDDLQSNGVAHQTRSISGKNDLSEFFEVLQLLVREPSVVGAEDSFFRLLRRELEEVGARVQHFHGLLVAQGQRPKDVILSAHI